MEDEEIQDQKHFETLIQGLIDNEYGCCNDFISPSIVNGLRANIQLLSDSGQLKPSGLGFHESFRQDNEVRGDKINWIDEQSINEFEKVYIKKMEQFILHLNRTCFTAIKDFECHYASYERRSFYKRHLDQFKNEKGRKYSTVLYLNNEWEEGDGGLLSLYPEKRESIKIAPLAGRMVLFRSDEMQHEVHASFTRVRNSIAGWLKN